MRVSLGLLALLATLFIGAGSTAATPSSTDVVRWSPFDSAARIKKTLKVDVVKGGSCVDIGYTLVGGIAYRCGAGNGLFDACWRDGPNPTEFVICIGNPWQRTVSRLRSPHLLLYPGVTFEAAAPFPWAIELTDGNRCTVFQGAHSVVRAHGKTFTVDYYCERDHVVLLRQGLRRGRLWQVKAARWNGVGKGFTFRGDLPIRRVYFGTLPPPLARQHRLAREAVVAAKSIIRRTARRPHLDLVSDLAWVRLALPRADWARVIFEGVGSDRGWFALLHRVNGVWRDASAYRPYCVKLPKRVRQQLFLDRHTWNPLPQNIPGPRGEERC